MMVGLSLFHRRLYKRMGTPVERKSVIAIKYILLALLFLPQLLLAESFAGKCIGISDGDTISVLRNQQSVRVRLEGIDSPEKGQDFSSLATKFTSNLAFGQEVSVQIKEYDRYGRIVGRVSVGEKDLSTELVKAGLAWHYKQYSSDKTLANAENQARNIRVGLWSLPNPKPPWEYRRQGRKTQTLQTTLHGNVRSKVLHQSRCRYYHCKNCTELFNLRTEAISAGYRPCKICKP